MWVGVGLNVCVCVGMFEFVTALCEGMLTRTPWHIFLKKKKKKHTGKRLPMHHSTLSVLLWYRLATTHSVKMSCYCRWLWHFETTGVCTQGLWFPSRRFWMHLSHTYGTAEKHIFFLSVKQWKSSKSDNVLKRIHVFFQESVHCVLCRLVSRLWELKLTKHLVALVQGSQTHNIFK